MCNCNSSSNNDDKQYYRWCDVLAYDDRQKAKRESIISRPLFSPSDKSLSSTPASVPASSSSSSSSSSSVKSAAVQQKLATLSRIRHISASGRSRDRSRLFHSRSAGPHPKLANSQKVLGVRRRASDQMRALEPATKRRRMSDTLTSGEQLNIDEDIRDSNCANADTEKVDIDDRQLSESSPVKDGDTQHVANALSLVCNYNSSSSSNDNEWWNGDDDGVSKSFCCY